MSFLLGLLVGLFVGINMGVILYAIVIFNKTTNFDAQDCEKDYEKN